MFVLGVVGTHNNKFLDLGVMCKTMRILILNMIHTPPNLIFTSSLDWLTSLLVCVVMSNAGKFSAVTKSIVTSCCNRSKILSTYIHIGESYMNTDKDYGFQL